MRRRHPVPTLWLMTDERLGDDLWPTLAALPRGSGVIFRDYSFPPATRHERFARVSRIARQRGLILLRAGGTPMRGEMGAHNAKPRHTGLHSRAVHDRRELIAARRAKADVILVSPLFATRSHPGARSLGPVRLGLLLRDNAIPAIALGGMNATRFRRLSGLNLHGWAAIDGLRTERLAPRRILKN